MSGTASGLHVRMVSGIEHKIYSPAFVLTQGGRRLQAALPPAQSNLRTPAAPPGAAAPMTAELGGKHDVSWLPGAYSIDRLQSS